MKAQEVINLAKKYAYNESSHVCLNDAVACLNKGQEKYAKLRAIKSLTYSVGVFHSDYIRAVEGE